MLSFMIASPVSSTLSAGITVSRASAASYTSPGTRVLLSVSTQSPSRSTRTVQLNRFISRIRVTVRCVSTSVEAMLPTEMSAMHSAYQ